MDTHITAERRKHLAEKHCISEQYLYQCLTGRREMKPALAVRIEAESMKELTRQMLCRKTHADIWLELAPGSAKHQASSAKSPVKPIVFCHAHECASANAPKHDLLPGCAPVTHTQHNPTTCNKGIQA